MTKIDPKMLEWATAREKEYVTAVNEHGSLRSAAKALGVAYTSVQESIAKLRTRAAKNGYAPGHFESGTAPGFTMGKVTVQRGPAGEVERTWERQSPDQERAAAIMREVAQTLAEDLPRQSAIKGPLKCDVDLCNLVVFTDYHMGQLAWAKEGGADWDLKIAEQVLYDAFAYMVDAAPRASTGIVCLQGDFLHTDGLLPLTPAHKNVLDADGRFSKIVATAIRVIRKIINLALRKHEKVHLVICEGNHDEASSLWLRLMFAALYEAESRLSVNDSELPYYAYQHGETMIAFHHGHKLKPEQLPGLFAAQFSRMWGDTRKRYAHCGHRHHVDEKEYSGMIVTQHPTLAARDAHASRGGWIADRAAQVITYHKRFGQRNRVIVCPEMFEVAT